MERKIQEISRWVGRSMKLKIDKSRMDVLVETEAKKPSRNSGRVCIVPN